MQKGNTTDGPGHELHGGTGSMLQDSASMLAETGQEKPPVRKQIGKAKKNTGKAK